MRYVYAVLAGIAITLGITVWWMLGTMNSAAGGQVSVGAFVVEKGEQLRHVANRLENEKLIRSAGAWTLYTLTTGQRSAILAGTYTLDSSMTGRSILRTLTLGNLKVNEVTVTIREGRTLAQIASDLEQVGVVKAADFLTVVHTPKAAGLDLTGYRIANTKPTTVDLEGYIFPDTYRFYKDSTGIEAVKKFLETLDLRFTENLVQAAVSAGHTPHDILTMASILEAELQTPVDRAVAADLFWRRIKIGMGLNADTTILYALGRVGGGISAADLKVDSPYNTYTNRGLPPGPINNPGLDAIRAAIYPSANEYLYYLSAPDGTTYFARTLDEHNRNKRQYLK